MILHLDEFDESESRRRLALEASTEETARLFETTEYQATGPLNADVEVNLVGTTIRVRGLVETAVGFHCGRCLEQREQKLSVDAEFVLMEKSEWSKRYEADSEFELADDDMDVSFYEGEDIDLSSYLREAILLDLPTLPRCPDSERVACDDGYRRNVGEAALDELEEASLDQRWAALKNIKVKD